MKKRLRWGYTTGACAAAAAKAAMLLILGADAGGSPVGRRVRSVEIPFPDGRRHSFEVRDSGLRNEGAECVATASVVKDAGDDPDVTDGAEIVAEVKLRKRGTRDGDRCSPGPSDPVSLRGGPGVGIVTKPGLPVAVGEAAINPVPRRMIREALTEAMETAGAGADPPEVEVTISVVNGEEMAKRTLNHRLGIVGGISILGTTGYVRPVSAEAWTATITSSMDVARATGQDEVVLSAGRASEKAHMKRHGLPEECYVLIGDYLAFSLLEAKRHGFDRIHLCAQWAKMLKIAMATPQTHVRFGAIAAARAVEFLNALGADLPLDREFNTAREIFEYIVDTVPDGHGLLDRVCSAAGDYAEEITGGVPVTAYLVSYEGEIVAGGE